MALDATPAEVASMAHSIQLAVAPVFLLSGMGGAGKSTIALQECVAQVLGLDWFGVVPVIGRSMFIDAEEIGGTIPRTLYLRAADGNVTIRSQQQTREL